MKLLLLLSLFLPYWLFGASLELLNKQLKVLNTVSEIAKSIPDAKGHTYEETLSAICFTESGAGINTVDNSHKKSSLSKSSLSKSSFGIMQIQVPTARYVAKQVKELHWVLSLSDAQIAKRLIKDTRFSARIATHYFVLLQNKRENYMHSISGYNGGVNNQPYYKRVMQNLQVIKQLTKKQKIS